MDQDPYDLSDLVLEEVSRGRRQPVLDASVARKRAELLRDLRRLLEGGDERLFLEAIRVRGLQDGSEAFERARDVWRQIQRGK